MSNRSRHLFSAGIFSFVIVSAGASRANVQASTSDATTMTGAAVPSTGSATAGSIGAEPLDCVSTCGKAAQKCVADCRWSECGRKCPRQHTGKESKACDECMAKQCGVPCNKTMTKCMDGCEGK